MAYQSIDLGTSAGDGTGDDIRTGGDKINDNFVEIYTLLGTGSALTSGISATATIVTLTAPTISGVASFADNGSAEDPVITRSNDVNTGIFFPSGDNLSVTTGGVLRTTVNSTGLIVVGDITSTGAMEPAGDTNAGDNAAIGYTSVEGLILTGQGSTNDITIKNDNDEDVLEIPTGTTNVTVVGDIITASTLQATGDTAAGDNAAIGYTSVEGLILTGQGSTNDVTIKNDADADVIEIPTGTVNVTIAGKLGVAGDTAAGDDAAIGYTAAEGLILTGQGSTNDVTIKNDADADVIEIPTGTVNVTMAGTLGVTGLITASAGVAATGNVTSTGTVEPAGDTAAGDNAAIGYTAAEGLILTGQGSTNDITIKNDADADVIEIPTGTTNVTFAGNIAIANAGNIGSAGDADAIAIASDGVVTFSQVPVLPNNTIETADIQADAITGAKIADDAINSEHYAADSIDEEHIANDAVGSAELKTLSTLLVKNSAGSTLKTIHGAGA